MVSLRVKVRAFLPPKTIHPPKPRCAYMVKKFLIVPFGSRNRPSLAHAPPRNRDQLDCYACCLRKSSRTRVCPVATLRAHDVPNAVSAVEHREAVAVVLLRDSYESQHWAYAPGVLRPNRWGRSLTSSFPVKLK